MFKLFNKKSKLAFENLPVETKKDVYIDTLTYRQFNELVLSLSDDISKIADDPVIQSIMAAMKIENDAEKQLDALEKLDKMTGTKRFDYIIKHIFKTKEIHARNILATLTGNDIDAYKDKLMLDVWRDINAIKNSKMKYEVYAIFFSR